MSNNNEEAPNQQLSTTTTTSTIRIQHDWEVSINEAKQHATSEKIWIMKSERNKKTIYEDLFVTYANATYNFTSSSADFAVNNFAGKYIDVSYKQQEQVRCIAPSASFQVHSKKKPVSCIDVSLAGNLGISATEDGQVRVWDGTNGTLKRDLQGHIGDVYVCKLLPSNQVAMTAGADVQIKIWRLEDGLCAVTLPGHTGAIKQLAFVDRGRNFISCAKDGTVKLWDCASQTCITNLLKLDIPSGKHSTPIPINDCYVAEDKQIGSEQEAKDARDFNTEHKIALACAENGSLVALDLRSRKILFKNTIVQDALNACVLSQGHAIAASQAGQIFDFDLRKITSTPYQTFTLPEVPITALERHTAHSVWFTTQDGACSLLDLQSGQVTTLLTGPDYETLHDVAVAWDATPHAQLFTACRDGRIRKYQMPQ